MNSEDIQAVITAHPDFSGVVLIRKAGQIVYGRGLGFANRAEGIPNTLHTRFATASGTKTFTAVSVCQLVDQGKIAFDTLIKDCVSQDFPLKDSLVTVHHLLSHTSGLPDYYDEELPEELIQKRWDNRPIARVRRPVDVLPLFPNDPIKFAPGERFNYNNGGYILLGLVIEAASGMAYPDYVTENIFRRAGMDDSGFFPLNALPPRAALGYLETEGYATNIYALPEVALSDGGAFVTAVDMGRFWHALRNFQLLTPETTARMMQPHVEANDDGTRCYGYGLWLSGEKSEHEFFHALGGDAGVAFVSRVYPHSEIEMTVIGNDDKGLWSVISPLTELVG